MRATAINTANGAIINHLTAVKRGGVKALTKSKADKNKHQAKRAADREAKKAK